MVVLFDSSTPCVVYTGTVLSGLGMDDGSALSPTPMSSDEVSVTDQLERILSTNVAVGETMKVEAAAGAGKSTALRLYVCRMSHAASDSVPYIHQSRG